MVQNPTRQKGNRSEPNNPVTASARLFPDCLGELFAQPPTLKTEDNKVYWDFLNAVVECIKPQEIFEWIWVKDVVDLSWEILRFRKLKITLIEIERENTNAAIEWDREHPDEPEYDLFTQTSRARTAREIEFRKNRPLHNRETDSANLLWRHIEQYEHIERLLTSAELRRDRILREIELRRAELSRPLRETTDQLIDDRGEQTAVAAE